LKRKNLIFGIQRELTGYVFISKDGLRKIRFDINSPHGDAPHIHLEIFKNRKMQYQELIVYTLNKFNKIKKHESYL